MDTRITGRSLYNPYQPYVTNTNVESKKDESEQSFEVEKLYDMDVETSEKFTEGHTPFMLTLLDYDNQSDPEVINENSTIEFVKNLTMKDDLWRNVLISGDVDPSIVAAIPKDIAYIYIGAKATPNCINAIPSHIHIVKICEGVHSEVVAALPESVCAVFIESGVSPDTVKSLPEHIRIAIVEDLRCNFPMQVRGIVKLDEELQQIKLETVKALPQHITIRPEMDEVVIGRDKSASFVVLKHTYLSDLVGPTSTCSLISDTASPLYSSKMNSFFDTKHPSALKVINVDAAIDMLRPQIGKGWRWVSPEFISDIGYNEKSGYAGYRVEATENEPEKNSFVCNDFVVNSNITVKSNFTTFTPSYFINRNTNERELVFTNTNNTQSIKSLIDSCNNLSIQSTNPVVRSKQIPTLSVGDWVIMQGKTMRLIKARSNNALEKSFYGKLEHKLAEINKADNSRENTNLIYPKELRLDFFKGTYSRLAGAYLRRLERLPKLQEAYQKFFSIKEIKLASDQHLSVQLYDKSKTSYTEFYKVELKKINLTADDVELLHQALGIRIAIRHGATIENTVPFKKVLEILSACNTIGDPNIPVLVSLNIMGIKDAQFLLSPAGNQLFVSTCRDTLYFFDDNKLNKKGKLEFSAHSYTFYFMYPETIKADLAHSILENPIAQSTRRDKNWQMMIEFLVCTQVVEAHFSPGKLTRSRVPGSNKLARYLIRMAAQDKGTSLAGLFSVYGQKEDKGFFPMAGTGGTRNTRDAVNALSQNTQNNNRKNNAPDYDMSDDSDG